MFRSFALLLLAGLTPTCSFAESEWAIDDEKPAVTADQPAEAAPAAAQPADPGSEVVTEESSADSAAAPAAESAKPGEEVVTEEAPSAEPPEVVKGGEVPVEEAPAKETPAPETAPAEVKAPAVDADEGIAVEEAPSAATTGVAPAGAVPAPAAATAPADVSASVPPSTTASQAEASTSTTKTVQGEDEVSFDEGKLDKEATTLIDESQKTATAAGAWAKADSQTKDAAKSKPAPETAQAEDTGEAEIIEEAPAATASDSKEGAPAVEETAVTASQTALPASAKKEKTADVAAPVVEEVIADQEETTETPPLADEPAIEAGPEESARPVVETEAVPEAELAMPELEAEPAPVFVWSAKAQERAFDDFLKAGFEVGTSASPVPVSLVVDTADGIHSLATLDEAVIIKGSFKRGQLLAAYHVSPGGCGAGYVGILAVVRTAGQATCRAVVKRITERVSPGDLLVPLEEVRADFERQKRTAARGAGGEVTASVSCISDERDSICGPNDIIQLDRGSANGVALGWLAQAQVPGKESELTYGRVVRVGRNSCYIRIAKIYQPLVSGDPVRLSFAGSAGRASGSANPGTGKVGNARRPARPADALASKRR